LFYLAGLVSWSISLSLHPLRNRRASEVAISIDENQVALKRNLAHFECGCVFGRLIPGSRLLHAPEFDDDNVSRVPIALQRLNFSAAGEIAPALRTVTSDIRYAAMVISFSGKFVCATPDRR